VNIKVENILKYKDKLRIVGKVQKNYSFETIMVQK
jgi:hypothetical protein